MEQFNCSRIDNDIMEFIKIRVKVRISKVSARQYFYIIQWNKISINAGTTHREWVFSILVSSLYIENPRHFVTCRSADNRSTVNMWQLFKLIFKTVLLINKCRIETCKQRWFHYQHLR